MSAASEVQVRVGAHDGGRSRAGAARVTLALGMPANDRMDTLVEKATELGVACIQPLVCERSVLRLAGERAVRKREHWQAHRRRRLRAVRAHAVPRIEPVRAYANGWPACRDGRAELRWLLSRCAERGLDRSGLPPAAGDAAVLSGPEGGFTPAEEIRALAAGFVGVGLGPRVLRADTAPLAVLAWIGAAR